MTFLFDFGSNTFSIQVLPRTVSCSSLSLWSSYQNVIVFVYVRNLGIVHAAQYRMNYGQKLIKDEEAYASLGLLNSNHLKRPLYLTLNNSQPLISLYSYRNSLGTTWRTTPFSFGGTSTFFVQAPELITAPILAGAPNRRSSSDIVIHGGPFTKLFMNIWRSDMKKSRGSRITFSCSCSRI